MRYEDEAMEKESRPLSLHEKVDSIGKEYVLFNQYVHDSFESLHAKLNAILDALK